MKPCRKCAMTFTPKPHQLKNADYVCTTCSRAEQAAWRAKRKALGLSQRGKHAPDYERRFRQEYRKRPDEQVKYRARVAVSNAIQSGKLTRQPCEQCGAERTHAHHDDYSEPLSVRWLCKPHHDAHHRAEGRKS